MKDYWRKLGTHMHEGWQKKNTRDQLENVHVGGGWTDLQRRNGVFYMASFSAVDGLRENNRINEKTAAIKTHE